MAFLLKLVLSNAMFKPCNFVPVASNNLSIPSKSESVQMHEFLIHVVLEQMNIVFGNSNLTFRLYHVNLFSSLANTLVEN